MCLCLGEIVWSIGRRWDVSMIMMSITRRFVVLGLLLLFTTAVMGQNVSEQFCKRIENSVVKQLNPTKIDRQEVYTNECVFEFTVAEDVDVLLSIEKYNTEEESHESLQGWLYYVDLRPGFESKIELPLEKLDTNNSWDEVYFKKADEMNSGFVLLRKGKAAITMLSLKDEILIQMEKLLRGKIDRGLAVTPRSKN